MGNRLESLFSGVMDEVRRDLHERLKSVPQAPRKWLGRYNRENTISGLRHRLAVQHTEYGS